MTSPTPTETSPTPADPALEPVALVRPLERLERSLELPVLPGEQRAWLEEVRVALEEVDERIPAVRVHDRERLERIAETDPALLARTEELSEQEDLLARDLAWLVERVADLTARAEGLAGDEARLDSAIEELMRRGLDLVIDARRQRLALQVWFEEAMSRDRGRVD